MSTSARAADIVFTRHPARRGVTWLREAWTMFSQRRLSWLALIALYYVLMLLVNVVPLVGQLAVPLLRPVFAVGLLAAAWTQERGGRLSLSLLFKGFRANVRALIPLGMAFIAGIIAAMLATWFVDEGLLLNLVLGRQEPTAEVLASGRLQLALLLAALVALPTVLALWFAPALVVFQDAGPSTALGASLRAALANWRPIIVYALTVFLFGVVLPLAVAQLFVLVAPTESTLVIVRFLLIGWGLMFAATLHISDYVSYRDVFHLGETLAPLSAVSAGGPR